jgi:hypothetical protein
LAVASVQHKDAVSTASVASQSVTFTNPTTTGNFILLTLSTYSSSSPVATFTITDNKGNSAGFIQVTNSPSTSAFNTQMAISLFYCPNITGGATHTITVTGSKNAYISISAEELSGVDITTPVESFVKAGSGSGTSASPGVLTATDGSFILGAISTLTRVSFTANVAFTKIADYTASNVEPMGIEILSNAAAGSYSASWTLGGSSVWIALAASVRAAGGVISIVPIIVSKYFRYRD